ncbi:MAG: helix-turn-helix transcriptional regulator [Coriobacteriia bacterium]|nr:helix-turn-helix transcriptional regulator [Coriobacteriia bacterium]
MSLMTHIREQRVRFELTQRELADRVGVRRETIVHLEHGEYNPSLRLAMDIAEVFGVTVEELFEYAE